MSNMGITWKTRRICIVEAARTVSETPLKAVNASSTQQNDAVYPVKC